MRKLGWARRQSHSLHERRPRLEPAQPVSLGLSLSLSEVVDHPSDQDGTFGGALLLLYHVLTTGVVQTDAGHEGLSVFVVVQVMVMGGGAEVEGQYDFS